MEGGAHEFDGSTFKECFSLSWRNPYVLRLAFSAGIGGLLFGYDTGARALFLPVCVTVLLFLHLLPNSAETGRKMTLFVHVYVCNTADTTAKFQ